MGTITLTTSGSESEAWKQQFDTEKVIPPASYGDIEHYFSNSTPPPSPSLLGGTNLTTR